MPLQQGNKDSYKDQGLFNPFNDSSKDNKDSFPEGEIELNKVILIPKDNPSEANIDLNELLHRVGADFFKDDYVNNVRKGVNDYNLDLKNGSKFYVKNHKFKNPSKKNEKNKKTKKKKGGSEGGGGGGGGGGAGDASRGQTQAKNISHKFIVIFIWMILSVQRLQN
ncbi:UNVERIFIED_CONTAM: hypothetical protein RMT77_017869 [Armadillidium vulgare]